MDTKIYSQSQENKENREKENYQETFIYTPAIVIDEFGRETYGDRNRSIKELQDAMTAIRGERIKQQQQQQQPPPPPPSQLEHHDPLHITDERFENGERKDTIIYQEYLMIIFATALLIGILSTAAYHSRAFRYIYLLFVIGIIISPENTETFFYCNMYICTWVYENVKQILHKAFPLWGN